MLATARVAEFIVKSRWEDCPPAAVDAARRAILDCLGVMLAGSLDAARAHRAGGGRGGGRRAALHRRGHRPPDGRRSGPRSPTAPRRTRSTSTTPTSRCSGIRSAPVLAAALAAGELALADGRALVHAFLLGFEVETTVAEVDQSRRTTSTAGTRPVPSARSAPPPRRPALLGLDGAQTQVALAVAASQASGLKENFGTMTKPFHAGHAARSGVLAALLAREGWTASAQALEGPQGYFSVLGAGALAPGAARDAGRAVEDPHHRRGREALSVVRVHPLDHRRRPRAASHHGASAPADVAEVTVGVNAPVPRILIHSNPRTGLEAKFSGEFCGGGRAGRRPAWASRPSRDDKRQDPAVRAAHGARREWSWTPRSPATSSARCGRRLTVRLADGGTRRDRRRGRCRAIRAHPMTLEALREKFDECAGLVLPADRVQTVRQIVEALDDCPDLRSLTAILSPV